MKAAIFPSHPVLLVDDEEQFLASASFALRSEGISNLVLCQDSRKVLDLLSAEKYSLVVLDLVMPHVTGQELLAAMVEGWPQVPVVVTTALNEVETAVECMKAGAIDYLVKPVDATRLVTTVRRALEYGEVRKENDLLKHYLLSDKLEHPEAFREVITASGAMRSIFQYVEAIARTSLPVLITGETGVGKELIARALHRLSGRSGEFVAVNVAGVDDTLFSDTLFGHRRGAFTGADRDRKGLIEQAQNGTLFLDEIGDLRPESQVKLLRLLAEGKYYPLGADMPKLSDARIVVATHRDLRALQQTGSFRKDLFYRLQAHHVHIPPLRERPEDIPILAAHFLEAAARTLGKKPPTAPKKWFPRLQSYPVPGTVREREAMVFDAVSRHKGGTLSLETFKDRTGRKEKSARDEGRCRESDSKIENGQHAPTFPANLPTLKQAERALIREALRRAQGNQTLAASLLGISRRALNNRLSRERRRTRE